MLRDREGSLGGLSGGLAAALCRIILRMGRRRGNVDGAGLPLSSWLSTSSVWQLYRRGRREEIISACSDRNASRRRVRWDSASLDNLAMRWRRRTRWMVSVGADSGMWVLGAVKVLEARGEATCPLRPWCWERSIRGGGCWRGESCSRSSSRLRGSTNGHNG